MEGRGAIWEGGARQLGMGEMGQRRRVAVRNWGGVCGHHGESSPPHPPDQSQSDALPSSALLLLTTVLGGRYCHRSAYEEKVGRCIICSGAQMAGEWGAQGPRAVRL